jgi:hypothetical protein
VHGIDAGACCECPAETTRKYTGEMLAFQLKTSFDQTAFPVTATLCAGRLVCLEVGLPSHHAPSQRSRLQR